MAKTPDLDLNPWNPHPPDEDSGEEANNRAGSSSAPPTRRVPAPTVDEPPAYSSAGTSHQLSASTSAGQSSLFPINPVLYTSPSTTLSPDQTTLLAISPELCTNPDALVEFIRQQSRLPPKPVIRVMGTHKSSTSAHDILDFDFQMSLMGLFVKPGAGGRSGWEYVKVREGVLTVEASGSKGKRMSRVRGEKSGLGNPEEQDRHINSLEEWAQVFCQDTSPNKT